MGYASGNISVVSDLKMSLFLFSKKYFFMGVGFQVGNYFLLGQCVVSWLPLLRVQLLVSVLRMHFCLFVFGHVAWFAGILVP